MAIERLPSHQPLPAIPAEPRALEHYQALGEDQRAALDDLIVDAQAIARRYDATMRLDWWIDDEVEDWENFVLRLRTEFAREDPCSTSSFASRSVHEATAIYTALARRLLGGSPR